MWAQILNAALGVWLMAAPAVLGYSGIAADNDHIAGPIAASFAIIACWEVTRGCRWVNVPVGLWIVIAPWIFSYRSSVAIVNSELVGAAIIILSFVRGKTRERFGGGWRAVFKQTRSNDPHANDSIHPESET